MFHLQNHELEKDIVLETVPLAIELRANNYRKPLKHYKTLLHRFTGSLFEACSARLDVV